jgi:hypothetical protein
MGSVFGMLETFGAMHSDPGVAISGLNVRKDRHTEGRDTRVMILR